jgi:hypothetical protein
MAIVIQVIDYYGIRGSPIDLPPKGSRTPKAWNSTVPAAVEQNDAMNVRATRARVREGMSRKFARDVSTTREFGTNCGPCRISMM